MFDDTTQILSDCAHEYHIFDIVLRTVHKIFLLFGVCLTYLESKKNCERRD